MAFLKPEFETDIFISYARVDDLTVHPRRTGWVTRFVQHLEVELWRRVGRQGAIEIWCDTSLDGNQSFDEVIKDRISRAGIFLALTSYGYLQSDYCRKELNWFRENAARQWGISIGDRSRLVNVLLYNLHPNKWPVELQGQIGVPFHTSTRDDEEGDPLASDRRRFTDQMLKLSKAVLITLEEIKRAINPAYAIDPAYAIAPDRPLVYMASVAESLKSHSERVTKELRQQGIRLITDIPPPYEIAEHDVKVKTEITRADISVHLLNELRGTKIIDDPSQSYPQRQVELGLEYAKSQLIWVPPSLDQQAISNIDDPVHRDLLNELENSNSKQSHHRFIRESPTMIAREVINQLTVLNGLEEKRQAKAVTATVLIESHVKDQLIAWDLGHALSENNFTPLINPQEENLDLSAKVLEERLRFANALFVLFGKTTEEWVRARLSEALRLALETPDCPLNKFAVCFVPPQYKEKGIRFDLGFISVQHFDLLELLDPRTLAEFLKS